mmetsp:Transcript_20044/g.34475  ORF Transcript_20044/g.34475 Transcript_20044/m.34475 type:complete len:215 (-) Transcript_20044:379-1023(-)
MSAALTWAKKRPTRQTATPTSCGSDIVSLNKIQARNTDTIVETTAVRAKRPAGQCFTLRTYRMPPMTCTRTELAKSTSQPCQELAIKVSPAARAPQKHISAEMAVGQKRAGPTRRYRRRYLKAIRFMAKTIPDARERPSPISPVMSSVLKPDNNVEKSSPTRTSRSPASVSTSPTTQKRPKRSLKTQIAKSGAQKMLVCTSILARATDVMFVPK